jgi:hypothetical protein
VHLLTPERRFARIYRNLRPRGLLILVNHGAPEAAIAHGLCDAAGLNLMSSFADLSACSLSPSQSRDPVVLDSRPGILRTIFVLISDLL